MPRWAAKSDCAVGNEQPRMTKWGGVLIKSFSFFFFGGGGGGPFVLMVFAVHHFSSLFFFFRRFSFSRVYL